MKADKVLDQFCDELASSINESLPTFEGHDLRADAGESGMIYVALRGAKKKTDLGESLAERIAAIADDAIAAEDHPIDFAISMGRGNKDLLLQIECRVVGG